MGPRESISQIVNFRKLRYEANRPSRFDWFGLRYGFEPLPVLGCKEYRLGTVSRRSAWHCSNFRVLRPGIRFGHRSRDDLCRAGIAFLGHNQRHPSPIGRRRTATMDSRANAGAFSRANWLVVVLLFS